MAETFLGRMSEQDNNLQFVRDMLTKRSPQGLELEVLTTYREIYRDKKPVLDEEQNLVKSHLKLSGVVRREGRHLAVRNRIYQEVFSEDWIREHLPESFWQRNKPILKVAIPVTAASVLVAVGMAGLAREADKQRMLAEEQRVIAEQNAQEAEEQRKIALEQTEIALEQTEIAQENETAAEEALEKERAANEQREIALATADTQRQRAEEQASIAQRQRQRAETQATLAREQTRRAEAQTELAQQQTELAQQQKVVAQLREQAARVLNLLPTSNTVSGLVLAVDTMAQSESLSQSDSLVSAEVVSQAKSLEMEAQSSLLKAVQTSKETNRLEGHGSAVYSVAFSPNGERLVSGSFDGTLRLWDAQTGNPLGEPLEGHGSAVYSVAFSPNGERLVSGSFDGTLRLWDAQTGNPLGEPLEGHGSAVYSVAFSPNGERLVSGSFDGTLRLWDASPAAWIDIACERLQYHPLLNEPATVSSDKEFYEVAARSKAVCQQRGWGNSTDVSQVPTHWVGGIIHRLVSALGR